MKNTFVLLATLFTFACSSPTQPEATLNSAGEGIPAGAYQEVFEDTPGLVRVTVKAGQIETGMGDYLNNKKHGTWTDYYPSGAIKSLSTYINGQLEGQMLTLSDRGELETVYTFHHNLMHGPARVYKRGKVVEDKTYVNGLLEGTLRKYYDNGTMMEESPYKNGKIHGISRWYDQEGNVTIEYEYDNGTLIKK